MEKRSYGLEAVEVRQESGQPGTISGYAAMFGHMSVNLGGFREIIAPGAFASGLEGDIRALWQHDSAQVLGRTKSGTLRLWEDGRGLGFELMPPDTQAGRDALTLIARGDVDQMSFGFNVTPGGDEWSQDEAGQLVRTLKSVSLIEVSPVTFPAYPDTSVGVMRSAEILESAPEWVQQALAQGGNHSTADGARARLRLHKRQLEFLALRGTGR